MVDAEDLRFLKVVGECAVQRLCRFQVVPDRFLDHDSRPFPVCRQAGIVDEARDFAKQRGRRGHVENALSFGAPLLFQACAQVAEFHIRCVGFEIALQIADVRRELLPLLDRGFPAAGELPDSLMQTLAQGVLAECDAVHRDNRKMHRNTVALREVKQGRHQLPPGQVAGSAEDDEYVWFESIVGFHRAQPFVQSVWNVPLTSTRS